MARKRSQKPAKEPGDMLGLGDDGEPVAMPLRPPEQPSTLEPDRCGNCTAWRFRQPRADHMEEARGRCHLNPEVTSRPATHWCRQHERAPQPDQITESSP